MPDMEEKIPEHLDHSASEKNITLAIALKTGEYIEKNMKNVTVIYTRKDDTFVELKGTSQNCKQE